VRFAIVADLHGKRGAWRRVTVDAARAGADRVVCLGDYLEAKVPWRLHDPAVRRSLDEVVRPDERLWTQLAGADLVLGNQEWRVRDLLAPDQVPDALAPLLAAPETATVGVARAEHGHRIRWSHGPDGLYLPLLDGLFEQPLLLVGHTHQTLLLDVSAGTPAARRLPVTVGRPVPIRPGAHLFANVGAARGHPSHWLLYDLDRAEITFREVDN
jgi:predicted phosphodiesterase